MFRMHCFISCSSCVSLLTFYFLQQLICLEFGTDDYKEVTFPIEKSKKHVISGPINDYYGIIINMIFYFFKYYSSYKNDFAAVNGAMNMNSDSKHWSPFVQVCGAADVGRQITSRGSALFSTTIPIDPIFMLTLLCQNNCSCS